MNQKTAKLLRRLCADSALPSSLYAEWKRIWNRTPRNQRHALRCEAKSVILGRQ